MKDRAEPELCIFCPDIFCPLCSEPAGEPEDDMFICDRCGHDFILTEELTQEEAEE